MERSGDGEMPGQNERANFVRSGMEIPPQVRKEGEADLQEGSEAHEKGPKPDFRIVQPEYNTGLGKTLYKDVGAMWKNTSKSGNEFYTLKIGKLKLLVFPNKKE
jgi:hypothetical protein